MKTQTLSKKLSSLLAIGALLSFAIPSRAQFTGTSKIGNDAPGSITTNGVGSYSVIGGGDDIWGDSGDDFTFHYFDMTGDFDVRMRVESLEMAANWTKAGIMAREDVGPTDRFSRMAFSRVTPSGGANDVHFGYRTEAVAGAVGNHEDGADTPLYPNAWVRLARTGNHMVAYSSHNGASWTLLGDQDTGNSTWKVGGVATPFNSPTHVGIAVSRHSGTLTTVHCEIREFLNAFTDPVTITANPQDAIVLVGATSTMSVGVLGGTDFETYQWFKNGSLISGATSSTYTTPALGVSDSGNHYHVVVTNPHNASTATSADNTVTVTSAPVILAAGNPDNPTTVAIRFSKPINATDASNAGLYTINNGFTISSAAASASDPAVVILTTSGPLTPKTSYTVTVSNVRDTDSPAHTVVPNPSTVTFPANGPFTVARIVYNRYENIGGAQAVAQLTTSPKFPNSPDFTRYDPPRMEEPQTAPNLEGFGGQFLGIYVAPSSGNYQFAIAADDNNQLYLSTDADPANKVIIAGEGDWTDVHEYYKFPNQVSHPITLVAGQQYYLEGLFKEGGGGDHIEVTVRHPGDGPIVNGQPGIPISEFAPMTFDRSTDRLFIPGPITITSDPATQSVIEGQTATFRVSFTGSTPATYVWYKNGVVVPGATGKTLSVPVSLADNGATFHVRVQNLSSAAVSADATLTVTTDGTKPTVVDAGCDANNQAIRLVFSQAVLGGGGANAADNPLNYSTDPFLTISGATLLSDNKTVVLSLTDSMTPLTDYNLSVQNVNDRAQTANTMDPATILVRGCVCGTNIVKFQMFRGEFGVNNMQTMTNDPSFPNFPSLTGFMPDTFWQQTPNAFFTAGNEEHYGFRELGWIVPSETGNFSFKVIADDSAMLRLSTDSSPANMRTIAIGQGDCGACSGVTNTSPISLNAGQLYYFEALFQEGGGGDHLQVQWAPPSTPAAYANIPGANLRYCYDPIKNPFTVTPPTDVTVDECRPASFHVTVNAPTLGNITYQWMREGIDVSGETGPTYTIPSASASADNGAQIQVRVNVFLQEVITDPVTLTVNEDTTPPTLVSAVADRSFTHVRLTFSEAMDPVSAGDPGLYQVCDSETGTCPSVSSAVLVNGSNVVLTLSDRLVEGGNYTATIQQEGLYDACGGPPSNPNHPANFVAAGSSVPFRGWIFAPFMTFQTYNGSTAGSPMDNFVNSADYINHNPRTMENGEKVRYITSFDSRQGYPDNSHEGYNGQLEGFFVPPVTGDYVFYISSDDPGRLYMNTNNPPLNSEDPAGAAIVVEEPYPSCCEAFSAHASSAITLNAGQRYYVNGLWREFGGGDYLQIVAKLASDPTDPNTLTTADNIGTYIDPLVLPLLVPNTLPTSGKLPLGSLTDRGFDLHLVRVDEHTIGNDLLIAEEMLAGIYTNVLTGTPWPNNAPVQYTIEPGIINYNIEPGPFGSLANDRPFPGLPQEVSTNTESIAMEAIAYVELHQGFHRMIVNSDDGFRVTPALCAADPNNAMVLGEFNGGRGSSDSWLIFNVAEDGLYPMRLIWSQGGGGANVEWVDIQNALPSRAGINGNDGIKAFRPSALFKAIRSGNNLHVTWPSGTACNWTLQSTPQLGNPSSTTVWTDVAGASPQDVPIGPTGNLFLRLKRNP